MKQTFCRILLLFALFAGGDLSAQEFLWDVQFDTRFDNREYSGSKLATSQTLFGARLTPNIGLGWGEGNSLMVGGDLSADFGSKHFNPRAKIEMYYAYESEKYHAVAGLFPRTRLIGDYSLAIFSDSTRFYDNTLEGFLLQYTARDGYVELGIDWDGMYDRESRESFRIFSSGAIRKGLFWGDYAFSMYHLAGSEQTMGVVDYLILQPRVGLALERIVPLDKLSFSVGWLQSLQRDRIYDDRFNYPGGLQLEAVIEKWGVGIREMAYIGKNQMLYYNRYGSRLYTGDPFFRTPDGFYNRAELYWHPVRRSDIDLQIGLVFHYDGRALVSQQTAQLAIYLNNNSFRKKPKPAACPEEG